MTTSLPRHGGDAPPSAVPSNENEEIPPSQWHDRKLFFRHWLRAPGVTGAMLPSSRAMARTMGTVLEGYQSPTVAELGSGTGAVTAVIQQRLRGASPHLAIEIHEEFAVRLQKLYPDVNVVNQSAADLEQILKEHQIDSLDVVISGLPFTAFTPQLQSDILDAVVGSLNEDGVFATHRYVGAGYFPAAQRFRALLESRFTEVTVSRPNFGNLPPARLLTARGPRKSPIT